MDDREQFDMKPVPAHVLNPVYNQRKGKQSWRAIISKVTQMTVQEAIDYYGDALDQLRIYPPDIILRELLIFRAVVENVLQPSPAMLGLLMEREEGKVPQMTMQANMDGSDIFQRAMEDGITVQELMAEAAHIIEQYQEEAAQEIKQIEQPAPD